VVGYGSLLSEASARETVPGLTDFRVVRVSGYRRIFNKVGINFISRFGQDPMSRALASCSTEPAADCEMICTLFNCPEQEFQALFEREHRFLWIEVDCLEADGSTTKGRMCTGTTDSDYRLNKCVTKAEYLKRVGRYYGGKIWRDDILPYPRYLEFCLEAADSHGEAVLENFLTTTFLADGRTHLKQYLSDHPEVVESCFQSTGYSYRDS
jgi:hypothetical protein